MDIEKQKQQFIELLKNFYKIKGKNGFSIREDVLLENGLGSRTFWETVCPILVKEKVLLGFDDPDGDKSYFNRRLIFNSEYLHLNSQLMIISQGLSRSESDSVERAEKISNRMKSISDNTRKDFKHIFEINPKKLLNYGLKNEPTEADKKRLIILGKLKEEWDFLPSEKNAKIYGRKWHQWENEAGIDHAQLESILSCFMEEGLINSFEFYEDHI